MTETAPLSEAKKCATEIVRALRERGHQAYFAGAVSAIFFSARARRL